MAEKILDFKDNDGKRYTFAKDNYERHVSKHPELAIPNFLERIKKAILEPYAIYPAHNDKTIFCYYYYEFATESTQRYTKVVVRRTKYVYIIITAFRPTVIKEIKYGKIPLEIRP